MIENSELQALYTLLASTVDGYNRTHSTQVEYLDFKVIVPIPFSDDIENYDGSLTYRNYDNNVLDYWYEAIPSADMFPFTDQSPDPKNIKLIRDYHRRESQRWHREGLKNLPWWLEAKERVKRDQMRELRQL